MEKGDYEQCKQFIDIKDPSVLLYKTIELIVHQATKNYIQRQLRLLDQYLIISRHGFYIHDIKNVMILLNLLTKQTNSEFKPRLKNMIELCSLPPLLCKSTDVLTYLEDLQEYFNMLAYLLVDLESDNKLQLTIAKTIMELLTNDYPTLKFYTPLSFRLKSAESGRFPEVIGELLNGANEEVYPILLKTLFQLGQNSVLSCKKIIEQHGLSSIFRRLMPCWRSYHYEIEEFTSTSENITILNYEDASKLAWILLKCLASHDTIIIETSDISPDSAALRGLQYAFRYFCLKKTKNIDRNNILAIILKCMDVFPDMFKNNAALAYDIAMLLVVGDVHFRQNHWTRKIKLKPNDDDYNFIIMLMMATYYFDQFFSGIRILEECRVLHGLLSLIKQNQYIRWHENQYCSLLCLALSLLKKIVPSLTDEFLEYGGTYCLLKIAKHSLNKRGDIKVLVRCLETLDFLTKQSSIIRESIEFNDGIFSILGLCEEILNQPILDSSFQRCLWHSINILQQICNMSTDVLCTIPFVVSFIKRVVKSKTPDPVIDPRVTVMFVNYLWDNIMNYQKCSKLFVRMGGVFLLLDLIEVSCYPVKLVSLGVLVDLCEDGDCIPYVITWRRNGKKIVPLLMEIFRTSNKYHEARTGPGGEIVDVNYPLMGAYQFHKTYCTCSKMEGVASMTDMIGSCRPKIYAILQMLNYRHKEQVEIANESYALFNDELSISDQVTLLLAENFLTLKLGEAWRELKFKLDSLGVEPVSSDKAVIDTLIEKSLQWGIIIRNLQFELLRYEYERSLCQEKDLYQKLKDPHLVEALEAIKELKYISRCVERMFRISSSLVLNNQAVKTMMQHQSSTATVHKTYLSNLSITPIFHQIMDIHDDIHVTSKNKQNVNIDHFEPVSPVSSVIMYHPSKNFEVELVPDEPPLEDTGKCDINE